MTLHYKITFFDTKNGYLHVEWPYLGVLAINLDPDVNGLYPTGNELRKIILRSCPVEQIQRLDPEIIENAKNTQDILDLVGTIAHFELDEADKIRNPPFTLPAKVDRLLAIEEL